MYIWYLHTIYHTKISVYTLKSLYLLHWGQITFWKHKKKHPNTSGFWCYLGSLTLGLCLPTVKHGNASYWAQSYPQHQLSKHDCYLNKASPNSKIHNWSRHRAEASKELSDKYRSTVRYLCILFGCHRAHDKHRTIYISIYASLPIGSMYGIYLHIP